MRITVDKCVRRSNGSDFRKIANTYVKKIATTGVRTIVHTGVPNIADTCDRKRYVIFLDMDQATFSMWSFGPGHLGPGATLPKFFC